MSLESEARMRDMEARLAGLETLVASELDNLRRLGTVIDEIRETLDVLTVQIQVRKGGGESHVKSRN